jgi:SAM-dependent methyltransferase
MRRLVRGIAFLIVRISRRLESFAKTLAIATFTPKELDALGVVEWEEFGVGGPITGAELFAWERVFFGAHIRPGDAMLVVGAGSGRDVLPFLAAGHDMTALDITPKALSALVARASAAGHRVATIEASIVDARLEAARYDVVSFSWFSYSYLRTRPERIEALRRAAFSLKPGGRILLSYPPAEANLTAARAPRGTSLAALLGGTRMEPGDHYSLSGDADRPNVFFAHFFAEGEVEGEAREARLHATFAAQPTYGICVMVLEPIPAA